MAIFVTIFLILELAYQDSNTVTTNVLAILMFAIPALILITTCIVLELDPKKSPLQLIIFRFFYSALKLDVAASHWPGYLFVSDGGHTENYALLPLIRRKCKLIIVCDGSQDQDETCTEFLQALTYAEERLYCSFFSNNPLESVTHSMKTDFIGNPNRTRFFSFTVRYNDGSEGKIVYLKAKKSEKKMEWNML